MSEYRRAIIAYLEDHDNATRAELANAIGASDQVTQRQIRYAMDLGFVVEAGDGDSEPVYSLPAAETQDVPPVDPEPLAPEDDAPAGPFEPTLHNADVVKAYVRDHPDDLDRVLAAERAGGRPRKTVLELAGQPQENRDA
jgi:hypothetical protein